MSTVDEILSEIFLLKRYKQKTHFSYLLYCYYKYMQPILKYFRYSENMVFI